MAAFEVYLVETDETLRIKENTTFQELAEKAKPFHRAPIIAAKFNNKIRELFRTVNMNGTLRFVDLKEADGMRVYRRGLIFLLYIAMKDLFPQKRLRVMHSLGNSLYCEVEEGVLGKEDLESLKQRMQELVEQDKPFKKKRIRLVSMPSSFSRNSGGKIKPSSFALEERIRWTCTLAASIKTISTATFLPAQGISNGSISVPSSRDFSWSIRTSTKVTPWHTKRCRSLPTFS